MLRVFCAVAALFALGLTARADYKVQVSSVSTYTITAAQHGMTCNSSYGVGQRVLDSYGNYISPAAYSVSLVGNNNCDIQFNFSGSFTGNIYLYGPFAPTSRAGDFQADMYGGDDPYVQVCAICDSGAAYWPGWGVMARSIAWHGSTSSASVIRVYLLNGYAVFASSNGDAYDGGCSAVDGDCYFASGVTTFPNGSLPLAIGTLHSNGTWTDVSDLR
jgi:hypothetical protein